MLPAAPVSGRAKKSMVKSSGKTARRRACRSGKIKRTIAGPTKQRMGPLFLIHQFKKAGHAPGGECAAFEAESARSPGPERTPLAMRNRYHATGDAERQITRTGVFFANRSHFYCIDLKNNSKTWCMLESMWAWRSRSAMDASLRKRACTMAKCSSPAESAYSSLRYPISRRE